MKKQNNVHNTIRWKKRFLVRVDFLDFRKTIQSTIKSIAFSTCVCVFSFIFYFCVSIFIYFLLVCVYFHLFFSLLEALVRLA